MINASFQNNTILHKIHLNNQWFSNNHNHFTPRTLSISTQKHSFITPCSTSTTLYRSRISVRRGHSRRTCLTVWRPVLQQQYRSSRGMCGVRPASIFRLCDPVRYRVTQTRWNSIFWSYDGLTRVGLTRKYAPSLESLSSSAAARIFLSKVDLKSVFSDSTHSSAVVKVRWSCW